ncbi:THAP domain-containing protein 8 [Nematolebias whitei]|uniref:THAP domain-containing protein 8 n=1 Tax=Nematolebias whitei TaxID=451745 RepID=UPI001896FB50|nr:THAP domain-containing protein 8 [Nematolebias whitei]
MTTHGKFQQRNNRTHLVKNNQLDGTEPSCQNRLGPEMPKCCSVPNCRNGSGSSNERRSFYKFPLQDPVRLQRWLRNMGRENWTPSRHQYVCHEHFSPSCFKVRWGVRYLESDAVPTVFQLSPVRREPKLRVRKFC